MYFSAPVIFPFEWDGVLGHPVRDPKAQLSGMSVNCSGRSHPVQYARISDITSDSETGSKKTILFYYDGNQEYNNMISNQYFIIDLIEGINSLIATETN